MASLPAYITQDDDDLDVTMDNLSLDKAKEEEKEEEEEDIVMANATNRDTENLAAQEDSIMDNTIHQAHENSIRAFYASLPNKKLVQLDYKGNPIPDAVFKKRLADLKKKKYSKKSPKKSPKKINKTLSKGPSRNKITFYFGPKENH